MFEKRSRDRASAKARGKITAVFLPLALALTIGACSIEEQTKEMAISNMVGDAAQAAVARRDFAAAANHFGRMYVRDPSNLEVLLQYLENLRRIGAIEDAYRITQKERANHGDDTRFLLAQGKVELAAGKAGDAIETFASARDKGLREWELFSAMGIAYDMGRRYDEAGAAYQTALGLSPGNPTVLNNMALSMAQAGDIDGAIELLRHVVFEEGKDSPRIRQNLALLYGFKGDIAQLEALARIDLGEDMVQRNVATFKSLGKKSE
jgi:Flp pilus assembly protein TadD